MLNLLKLKQEKAAAKEGSGEEGAKSGGKVIPAAQRRVQKGIFSARLPCQHAMQTSLRTPRACLPRDAWTWRADLQLQKLGSLVASPHAARSLQSHILVYAHAAFPSVGSLAAAPK